MAPASIPPPVEPQPLALDLTPTPGETHEPGRLRIYLGAAPGVGKTYRMLEDAHLMHRQGIDIVIGLIEAHGRTDTAALVDGLEIVPLKEIQYRSVTLREMDLDAILARHPAWCIVDELAHTNVPGSRNHKRYEDVLNLLDAGINVMTAMNVQHLETLNDAVARSASTTIRETVPDSFLRRANEVVNVDITIEELRDRLRQGKIYAPEKVEQALANFFRRGNLNMLRELALRTTAEQVGTAAAEYRRIQGLEQAPIPEKVMVCLSPRPGMERLVREVRSALHRRKREETQARLAVEQQFRSEIGESLTAMLLSCELAMAVPNIPPPAAEKILVVDNLAREMRNRLGAN